MRAILFPLIKGGDGLFLYGFGAMDQLKVFVIEFQNSFSGGVKFIHEIQSSGKMVYGIPARRIAKEVRLQLFRYYNDSEQLSKLSICTANSTGWKYNSL